MPNEVLARERSSPPGRKVHAWMRLDGSPNRPAPTSTCINPAFVRRRGRALIGLKRFTGAAAALRQGLALAPGNTALLEAAALAAELEGLRRAAVPVALEASKWPGGDNGADPAADASAQKCAQNDAAAAGNRAGSGSMARQQKGTAPLQAEQGAAPRWGGVTAAAADRGSAAPVLGAPPCWLCESASRSRCASCAFGTDPDHAGGCVAFQPLKYPSCWQFCFKSFTVTAAACAAASLSMLI